MIAKGLAASASKTPAVFAKVQIYAAILPVMIMACGMFWSLVVVRDKWKKMKATGTSSSQKKIAPAPELRQSAPLDTDNAAKGEQIAYKSKGAQLLSSDLGFRSRLKLMKGMDVKPITVWDKFVASTNVCIFLMYPSLCKQIFSLLNCKKIGEKSYLAIDLEIECYSEVHNFYILWLVMPSMLVYLFGVPLFCGLMVRMNSSVLFTKRGRLKYMMLTAGYRLETAWWESVVMLRKALLVGASVFLISFGVEAQVYVGTLIILVFATLHLYFRPFQHLHAHHANGVVQEQNTLHDLETYSFIAGTMTLYLGRSLLLVEAEGPLQPLIAITIFVVNIIFMVIALKNFLACLADENAGKIHSLEKRLHIDNKKMKMFDHLLDIDDDSESENEIVCGAAPIYAHAANQSKSGEISEISAATPVQSLGNWGLPSAEETVPMNKPEQ
jgi:hypothetical protein